MELSVANGLFSESVCSLFQFWSISFFSFLLFQFWCVVCFSSRLWAFGAMANDEPAEVSARGCNPGAVSTVLLEQKHKIEADEDLMSAHDLIDPM